MTHRKANPLHSSLLAGLLACTAITIASQAQASVFSTVQVIDASVLGQTKSIVTNGQNSNVTLNEIKTVEQQQLDAIGLSGTLGSLFDSSGLSSLGSESDFYTNMENFAFDPCAVNLCQVGDNPVGTTDIEEARDWAMENFFAGDILDPETERDVYEVRRRGGINAAVDGMAIATITHNDLAGAGDQADALDQVVSASQSLRGDIRANSAIALAAYKIQVQQLAMLTSLVEIQAMNNINSADLYHEDGGTTFPDAYLDEDFAVNDPTRRINVTPPDQGSASGSGLGGALLSSISGDDSVSSILSDAGIESADLIPTDVSSLADSLSSGALPSIQADDVTVSTLVADAASVARTSLENSDADDTLQTSMSMVQSGMAEGGTDGNTTALLGLAQSYATTGGNDMLSNALTTATVAIETDDTDASISFAEGVLSDLEANDITGTYVDYIESSISAVESGTQSASTLVLDSAAILSTLGSDTNSKVSYILQVDPAGATEEFFQQSLADALQDAATYTGNEDLAGVADTLGSITDQDIASLRDTMTTALE
jgi:hypothetical protein